jgi:hypothetical protein
LLRGSDADADVAAITRGGDSGVESDIHITAFVESVLAGADGVVVHREALRSAVGDAGLVDVCGVIAQFTMMVRIADACGIPLDKDLSLVSVGIREEMGVGRFSAARPTPWLVEVLGRIVAPLVPGALQLQTAILARLTNKSDAPAS